MKQEILVEEIAIELEQIETIVRELLALHQDVAEREPTLREKAAAGAFLAQFYTGVENILKRISRFYDVPLPAGDTWHVELFQRFCAPAQAPLPALFDANLAATLGPFRKFRHVVHHGYAFDLEWERMREGIAGIEAAFSQFKAKLSAITFDR